LTAPEACGRILLKSLRFREFTARGARVDATTLGDKEAIRFALDRLRWLASFTFIHFNVPHIAKSFSGQRASD
jgi:hypothetical protein